MRRTSAGRPLGSHVSLPPVPAVWRVRPGYVGRGSSACLRAADAAALPGGVRFARRSKPAVMVATNFALCRPRGAHHADPSPGAGKTVLPGWFRLVMERLTITARSQRIGSRQAVRFGIVRPLPASVAPPPRTPRRVDRSGTLVDSGLGRADASQRTQLLPETTRATRVVPETPASTLPGSSPSRSHGRVERRPRRRRPATRLRQPDSTPERSQRTLQSASESTRFARPPWPNDQRPRVPRLDGPRQSEHFCLRPQADQGGRRHSPDRVRPP